MSECEYDTEIYTEFPELVGETFKLIYVQKEVSDTRLQHEKNAKGSAKFDQDLQGINIFPTNRTFLECLRIHQWKKCIYVMNCLDIVVASRSKKKNYITFRKVKY